MQHPFIDRVFIVAIVWGAVVGGINLLAIELQTRSAKQKLLTGKEHRYASFYSPVATSLTIVSMLLLNTWLLFSH